MTQADTPLFDIIFRGDLVPGHQMPEVKKKLAQLFKADEQKINALFSGAAVPLKKNLDRPTAEKYQKVLQQAGADVQIAAAGKVTAKVAPKRPARKTAPEKAAKPMSMQERLAQQERDREQAAQEKEAREKQAVEEAGATASGWTLAPAGSDLLLDNEKSQQPAVEVDVSQLSLRPQEGNLVDQSERTVVDPVVIELADYGLSELGDDLLRSDEKSAEKVADVIVPEVDLAPAGSDLGQISKAEPPPPPDTSGISLE